MADPRWKLLTSVWHDAVIRLSSLIGGDLLDCLLSEEILTHEQYDSLRNSLKREPRDEVARDLLQFLMKTAEPSFNNFCDLLDTKIDGGRDLQRLLFERRDTLPSSHEAASPQASSIGVNHRQPGVQSGRRQRMLPISPPQTQSAVAAATAPALRPNVTVDQRVESCQATSRLIVFIEVDESLEDKYRRHAAAIKAVLRQYLSSAYSKNLDKESLRLVDVFCEELSRVKQQEEQEKRAITLAIKTDVQPKIRILFPDIDFAKYESNHEMITTHLCRVMQLKKSDLEIDITKGSVTLIVSIPGRGLINMLSYLEQNAEPFNFLLEADSLAKISFGDFPYVSVSVFDAPESEGRYFYESALVNNHLYLFGGRKGRKFFSRNEIWVMNLRVEASKRKWLRHLAQGRTIPPPCAGARCVVIKEMIYSYGGVAKDGKFLGSVYCLDPKTMKWIEVDAYIEGKPAPRARCCLCVIGSRIVMFGGMSRSAADYNICGWSNDIYELAVDNEEVGVCLDLKLSGTRPEPLEHPAMVSIDQHRAILFGIDMKRRGQSFALNLINKSWTTIEFDLSARGGHSHLMKGEFEEKSLHLLIGFLMITFFHSVYVSNIDDHKVYKMKVDEEFRSAYFDTFHCVQNEDKTTDFLVYYKGFKVLHLDPLFLYLQQQCAQLEREVICSRQQIDHKHPEEYRRLENENTSIMQALASTEEDLWQCKNVEIPAIRENLKKDIAKVQQRNDEISALRQELKRKAQDLASSEEKAAEAQRCIKEQEDKISVMRCDLASRQDDISALKQEYETCQRKATELENDLQKKNGENLAMRQELEQKERALASSEEKGAKAQRCIKEQEDKISVMKHNLASCQDEVAEAQRELGQRDDEIFILRQEYETCQSKATKLENDLQQKNVENSAMRQELDQKAQDLASCEENAAQAQHCLKEREDEISNISQKLSTFTLELAKAQRHLHNRNEEISTLKQEISSSQDKYDANTLTMRKELDDALRRLQNKNEENSTLREKLERLEVERSHVSTQTERRRNDEETNSPINRFLLILQPYYVLLLLLLGAICIGFYIGNPKTSSTTISSSTNLSSTNSSFTNSSSMNSSSTNSSPLSFYDARWNDFSWIICEAGLSKWKEIGLRLEYDWYSLQVIHERGQGSKYNCLSLLAMYLEKTGDSKEMRKRVVKACDDVDIEGRLGDIVKRKGYSISYDF